MKNVQCTLKFCRPASEKPMSSYLLYLWFLDAVYTTVLWRTELGFPRPFRFARKILSPGVALAVGSGSSPCTAPGRGVKIPVYPWKRA